MTQKTSNEVNNTFSPDKSIEQDWRKLFSELCYEVFYKNTYGAQLLTLLENRYFRSPVANPNREPSFAYFNEGQNEMIRSFTMGIQAHIGMSAAQEKTKKELSEALPSIGRKRKLTTRPIR